MKETRKMHIIPSWVISPSGKYVNCHIKFDEQSTL